MFDWLTGTDGSGTSDTLSFVAAGDSLLAAQSMSHQLVRRIAWAGVRFDALITPNRPEIDRRCSVGLGALTMFSLHEALSTLPIGSSVPLVALDRRTTE